MRDARCSHAHTRTLVLLRRRDRADVVDSTAGSQRTAVHHVLFLLCHGTTCPSRRASRQPAVPQACTCVLMVTTPSRGPELVKQAVTVRSGQSLGVSWGRRACGV